MDVRYGTKENAIVWIRKVAQSARPCIQNEFHFENNGRFVSIKLLGIPRLQLIPQENVKAK